jgi:hypothetical protein
LCVCVSPQTIHCERPALLVTTESHTFHNTPSPQRPLLWDRQCASQTYVHAYVLSRCAAAEMH